MMYNQNPSIPRHIHIIWIGQNEKMPVHCMESWVKMNPGWTVHLWTEQHLNTISWQSEKHIQALMQLAQGVKQGGHDKEANHIYASIADIMRYEILYAVGGFYVDANSFCIRPLEEWLFDSDFCASSANETKTPNLISNGYIASIPGHPILLELITTLYNQDTASILSGPNWIKTGSIPLTETISALKMAHKITLWPSHYFLPEYHSHQNYDGRGNVFARRSRGIIQNPYKESNPCDALYKNDVFARFPVFNLLVTTPTGPRVINKNDIYIGGDLYRSGFWSVEELLLLKDFVSEGSVVIEGGANIGSHTVDLCRMAGPSGKVLAFEPQRLVFQELVCNIALNNIPNAYCYNQGLGSRKTRLSIPAVDYHKTNNFGGISLIENYPMQAILSSTQENREETEIITIDSLALDRLDVMKLDVEGMEEDILKGAEQTIKRFSPVIYMESYPDLPGAPEARSLLRKFGYSLYRHGRNQENVLCLPANSTYKTNLPAERS
ncbi:FkbM family methyltransferase [Acetobacteraceae bacterium ESL0709]|nr:FkbM family methyltransferase [Acetobacteraceae bacterium ESL0697]MDF7678789.1 FkbM family methyltransferase [Acetobacteraceae bacterium ESL0709]